MKERIALYARVSTSEQRLDGQLDALRAYATRRGAEAVEFVDHGVSGVKGSRKALDALLRAVRAREVGGVVCTKLDRLARSTRHLCELAEELEALKIDLVVLDQAIDTATPSGKLLFQVLASVAEFERALIRERTRTGLQAARRRGATLGRPRALDRRGLERARRLRAQGRSLREIAGFLGVGLGTVSRAVAVH